MSKARDERRFVLIRLNTDQMLTALFNWRQFECISLPVFGGIPADAKASNVSFDPYTNGLVICIEHESFDPVPVGHEIPFRITEMSMETVRLPKTDTNQRAILIAGVETTYGTGEAIDFVSWDFEKFTTNELQEQQAEANPAKKSWEFLGAP